MIDEFIIKRVAPATAQGAKGAVKGLANAAHNLATALRSWFTDFRWIEFCAAVGAAFGAGSAMAHSLLLPDPVCHKIALFGAAVGAICYIRSPKTQWVNDDANQSAKNE